MKVFLVSLIGQLLLALVLWGCVKLAGEKGGRFRRVGAKVILALLLLFLIAFATVWFLPQEALSWVLKISNNYYVALMLFLTLFIGASLLGGIVLRLLKPTAPQLRKRYYRAAFLLLLPVTVVLCGYGYYNTMHPRVAYHRVNINKACGTDSLRIAFVSDIHVGEIISEKELKRLSEMVRAEQPDYVLVGGDVIDYYTAPAFKPAVEKWLKSLHPNPSHIIYVLGNHEYYYHPLQKEKWLRGLGVLLKDSVLQLQENLYLIGRDDRTNKHRAPLQALMQNIPQGAATIVLDHQPTDVKQERQLGVDLALHGHTHNGQFIPFKWVVGLAFERAYGFYRKGNTAYYVSSGYGVAGSPFRVGTHSEIAVLDLHFSPLRK